MKKFVFLFIAAIIIFTSIFRPSYMVMVGGDYHKSRAFPAGVRFIKRDFTAPGDIIRFLNVNGPRLAKKEVDQYLLQLIALQQIFQKSYERQLFSDTLNPGINQYKYQDLIALRNIKEEKIKDLVQRIYADGFKLSISEGMVYPEIDFSELRKKYGRYATREVLGYLRIMAAETTRHFSEDAGLMVSPDGLGGRIAAIEVFCKEFPGFVRLTEITKLHKMYLSAYLIGMNNTPAFSYTTNRLDDRFFKSYGNSMRLYKGTEFARLTGEYLKLLERNNYQKTQVVLDFVVEVVEGK